MQTLSRDVDFREVAMERTAGIVWTKILAFKLPRVERFRFHAISTLLYDAPTQCTAVATADFVHHFTIQFSKHGQYGIESGGCTVEFLRPFVRHAASMNTRIKTTKHSQDRTRPNKLRHLVEFTSH